MVKLDKGEFVGRAALQQIQQAGPSRKLVGLVMRENAIPRHGYPVLAGGEEVGVVTSGTASPTLGEKIAMAYLPSGLAGMWRTEEAAVPGEFRRGVPARAAPGGAEEVPRFGGGGGRGGAPA